MAKFRQSKAIFGQAEKERVSVKVGGSSVDMTDTQAYRFEELQKARASANGTSGGGVFDEPRYSLEDAAFRLMVPEKNLLQKAAAGQVRLFLSIAGIAGQWRSYCNDGTSNESASLVMERGYLALPVKSCGELLEQRRAEVAVVEFVSGVDPEALDLHADILAIFASWSHGNRFFCFTEPEEVRASDVYLMAPLTS